MTKNLILWLIIAAVLLTFFNNFDTSKRGTNINYSQFIEDVDAERIVKVTIDNESITGVKTDGSIFTTVRPPVADLKLIDDLVKHNVTIEGKQPEKQSIWMRLLIASFPILIILAVFMFFMRQMQGGSGGKGNPMSFGRSKARLLSPDQVKVTFADVAGCDEAKEEVEEVVDFLRDPEKFQKLGGKIPRGVLMVGPPGTGKTLLARAIAGEAKVPFFSISGSDFVEMFVGVGASRVRDMFEQAKKRAPCIIFIDEIDAVGRHRGVGMGGGHDEREQTLNQLLVEMDGFEVNDGVIVIAATNRPDVLDKALLRPGRFDRQVTVSLPGIKGREQILKVHMRKVPLDKDVRADLIARGTPGFSGAELANLVNEAALFSARKELKVVSMKELELAKDKIMMGVEHRSLVMSEREKEMTAYHESGHAILGRILPSHDPVYKVTIIPRGRALGVTMFLPEDDKTSHSRRYLLSRITSAYGGRIAEDMFYGADEVSTGAQNDIEQATRMARNMVLRWGLSEKAGAVAYGDGEEARETGMPSVSEETGKMLDDEIRTILDTCYADAVRLLEENRDKMELMKDALMEYEMIDSDQIDEIMAGKKPQPPKDWQKPDSDAGNKGEEAKAEDAKDTKEQEENKDANTDKGTKKSDPNVDFLDTL